MQRRIALAPGERFGRLVLLRHSPERRYGETWWECRCDCGQTAIARQLYLKRGNTRSCGCIRAEMIGNRSRTHGLTKTAEYAIWHGMKGRCGQPENNSYARYGGRGIRVCDRWQQSFEAFLADVGPRPSPAHSIDRIDSNGHYEPGNVRWATPLMQGQNTRRVRRISTDHGDSTIPQIAKTNGLSRTIVYKRLRRGWDIHRALTEPSKPSRSLKNT